MSRTVLLVFLPLCIASAGQSPERVFDSVLPSLASGPACWSTVEIRNLGDRELAVEVEAHQSSGALIAMLGHRQILLRVHPGETASYKLEAQNDSGDAWVKIREIVPSPRLTPVIAVAGTSECIAANRLHTTRRDIAYPLRNPWFAGDISEIPGDVISMVNTSEHEAKASLCYSAGKLYSIPSSPEFRAVCSHSTEVQIPPFGARQFPVRREGSSHFVVRTNGEAIVLQMLRPIEAGVRIYTVDSNIKFDGIR